MKTALATISTLVLIATLITFARANPPGLDHARGVVSAAVGDSNPIMGDIDVPGVATLSKNGNVTDTLDFMSMTLVATDATKFTVTITPKRRRDFPRLVVTGLVVGSEGVYTRVLVRQGDTWSPVEIVEGLESLSVDFTGTRGTLVINTGEHVEDLSGLEGGVSVQFSERSGICFCTRG